MKKIILTGGGTAGHVTPNLALLPALREEDFEIHYIGSYNGIERRLIEAASIPYDGISSGKLRRYFDLKNFSDPSKGCCNFPETLKYLPEDKAVLTGSPIREELLHGDRLAGLQYAHLSADRPVILIIGGSLGSVTVNQAVRSILPQLLKTYQVIHICGKGNLDESLIGTEGYVQYEYVDKPLRHLFAAADLIISRAGANSICEILALRKPNILIPLSAAASRGDQILNANSFAKQGFSTVLEEEVLTADTLSQAIEETYKNRQQFIDKMSESHLNNAVKTIMELIHDCTRS